MSYCKLCQYLSDDEHETPYGVWYNTCDKLNVGRNPDSDACNKFIPIEEVAINDDAEGAEPQP